jgi:hypothetical protein
MNLLEGDRTEKTKFMQNLPNSRLSSKKFFKHLDSHAIVLLIVRSPECWALRHFMKFEKLN